MLSTKSKININHIMKYILNFIIVQGQDVRNELVLKSDCVCIGFSITYECTVMGRPGGATVWTGTTFECPGNEITLLHHRFSSDNGPAIGECNDGAIRGRSIRVNGSLYTSQLTITVTCTADVIRRVSSAFMITQVALM